LQSWNRWLKIKITKRYMSVPGDLRQLGSLIKRERERAGMTVRQLADAVGLVRSTVSRLERASALHPGQSICNGWRKRSGLMWKNCT
jgi:DNA-binding XRE family transcriptional regulator